MIFVDGVKLTTHHLYNSSSSTANNHNHNHTHDDDDDDCHRLLLDLIKHPYLVSTSNSFKSIKQQPIISQSHDHKYVYVFQREYATVHPSLVHYVATDEATTCVGIVIRNRITRLTSIAHMDFQQIVDAGFTQMMSQLLQPHNNNNNTHSDFDFDYDVHLIGAFQDVSPQQQPNNAEKIHGYSFSLCAKIIATLLNRPDKFHIQTLFVLAHNTQFDHQGHARPIFTGFMIETATGSITPACFDRSSRCPDEIVRRIRVTAAYEDHSWDGKLLETYDTVNDRFVIAPCTWTKRQKRIAKALQQLSDREILFSCSTSPFAEASDFVENERRKWDYLIKHPDWEESFPQKLPRVFERTPSGGWKRCPSPGNQKSIGLYMEQQFSPMLTNESHHFIKLQQSSPSYRK
ncbi:hypothetical protein ACFE04_002834 [Oxalis oulophora]